MAGGGCWSRKSPLLDACMSALADVIHAVPLLLSLVTGNPSEWSSPCVMFCHHTLRSFTFLPMQVPSYTCLEHTPVQVLSRLGGYRYVTQRGLQNRPNRSREIGSRFVHHADSCPVLTSNLNVMIFLTVSSEDQISTTLGHSCLSNAVVRGVV